MKILKVVIMGILGFVAGIAIAGCFHSFAVVPTVKFNTNENNCYLLTDSDRRTSLKMKEGDNISFSLSCETENLYLKWDSYPENGWEISFSGENKAKETCNSGFLHELFKIENPIDQQAVLTVKSDCILTDIWFFGDDLPSFVEKWEKPKEKNDILIMSTHADDEHLYLGAPLATYAANPKVSVQVAYMVNHKTEPYRQHELLTGLYTVGVRSYPEIPDFPDIYSPSLEHAKTIYDEQEILSYQKMLIDKYNPQIIIGHDLNGEYGHGAHMLNAHCLLEAVKGTEVKKLFLHLYPENLIVLDVDTPLEYNDGKTAYQVAIEGFSKHSSQQSFYKVLKTGPYDMRKMGLAYSTVGKNETNDIMENIFTYSQQKKQKIAERIKRENQQKEHSTFQQEQCGKVEEVVETYKPASQKDLYVPKATNDSMFSTIGNFWYVITAVCIIGFAIGLFVILRRRRK